MLSWASARLIFFDRPFRIRGFFKSGYRLAFFTLCAGASFSYGADCPNIAGTWKGSNQAQMTISQTGCSISSEFSGTHHNHKLTGGFDSGAFRYQIVRSESGKCSTTMRGIFLLSGNENKMTSEIRGTDGKCELKADFWEIVEWSRAN